MAGIGHEIYLAGAEPTEEQIALYCVLIRSLRDTAYEHAVFEFADKRGLGVRKCLMFFQVCRTGNNRIHAEVRIDTAEGKSQYMTEMSDDEATSLLRELIRSRIPPDVSGWEDITEKVFPGRK